MKNCDILFFYSNYNLISLRTKLRLSDILDKSSKKQNIRFKEIDINKEPLTCKRFGIQGIPTTIILKNDIVLAKFLGDLEEDEMKLFLEGINL